MYLIQMCIFNESIIDGDVTAEIKELIRVVN